MLLAAVATTVHDPAPVKLSSVDDALGKLQFAVLLAPVVTAYVMAPPPDAGDETVAAEKAWPEVVVSKLVVGAQEIV